MAPNSGTGLSWRPLPTCQISMSPGTNSGARVIVKRPVVIWLWVVVGWRVAPPLTSWPCRDAEGRRADHPTHVEPLVDP